MRREGNSWTDLGFRHNAPTESLWGRLKVGRLYGRKFVTRRQAMDDVIDWLNFYNHKRLHSTLGYVSPMTFEQRWTAAQQQVRKSAQLVAYGVRKPGARSTAIDSNESKANIAE